MQNDNKNTVLLLVRDTNTKLGIYLRHGLPGSKKNIPFDKPNPESIQDPLQDILCKIKLKLV